MPFINDMLEERKCQNPDANRLEPRKSRFLFEPDRVMSLLHSRIVGQQGMKESMDDMLHLVKVALRPSSRPLAVMLFLGPTGVGKTETVRVVAEAIHGDPEHFCRIDMNTLSQQHYAAALTGAPPGYVGSKEGHTLFHKERIQGSFSKPGIVLFDELEKADRSVVRSIMNILDNGRLQLAGGTGELDFRNSLVFMTSNIGSGKRGIGDTIACLLRQRNREAPELRALRRHFDPEFLNRIDRTILFGEIGGAQLDQLLDVEFARLQQHLHRHQILVDVDESVRCHIKSLYDRQYGARDIGRLIRQCVEVPLARSVLNQPGACHFQIFHNQAGIQVISAE